MMESPLRPIVSCTSAEEFLNELSPVGERFKEVPLEEPWLFRGQGRDRPLVPSAFRRGGSYFGSLTRRDIRDYEQRLLAERDMLVQFFDIADRRGLVLPDDSQQLRTTLETLRSERGDRFVGRGYAGWSMADSALSLMALAQHYGLPTRLLDWSRKALIAAFFAAEGAVRDATAGSSDHLVVWAFYFPVLGRHDSVAKDHDPIRIVTAPSATNSNLKAQQGIFTLVSPHYSLEASGDYRPMETMIEEVSLSADPEHSDADKLILACRLQKFTLRVSEARRLLYLLAKLDVTPSAVYPGYQSIVDDLRIQREYSAP